MPAHDTPAPESRRPRLDVDTAAVRLAVRRCLADVGLPEGSAVLVAVSGGADSLALAAATAFEARASGIRTHAVVVDHGLQPGSDEIAGTAAEQVRGWGIEPHVVRVQVTDAGGPEAAARTARYAAIDTICLEVGATLVLLGHTLDDQAETVLLGLARGSGTGSLQGMAPLLGRYARPLLGVRRTQTRASCAALGIPVWDDPHNASAEFTRVRVRERVLPVLEAELGPGVAEALARTAEQAREDTQAFDEMIEEFIEEICEPAEAGIAVQAGALAANPAALRHRIIRYVAHAEFGRSLSRGHTLAIAALVTDWRGQGPIDVPGITVRREAGRLVFTAAGES
ncbi:tRNA(Ile)-lysidine synthase [Paramicrobacterium humi]|uniref:tRNA(Ile)-lysidine synthase n=1 Tax=Paramicrobacterium humi TaxID=640635 RepID=A0A1H4MND5_9MICO|nr:tRNA lysidine(34) synthetase TilS [Microbacterium humi]SEB84670.1 tRNA(Ile)-lysidine synthase [Microbacterium humi]